MLSDVFVQHGAEVVQFLKRQIHLLEKCHVLALGTDADALVQTLHRRVKLCTSGMVFFL
jgi:hypothetical protein